MNEKELAEIKARCEAATPGPWSNPFTDSRDNGFYSVDGTEVIGVTYYDGEKLAVLENNADFIAHARTDIPALVAEVERLNQIIADAGDMAAEIRRAQRAEDFAKSDNARLVAEVERLRENNERLKIALENEQSQFAKRNEENTRLRRVLMNIESAKRLHSGIPWEAMVMTLQDIARQGLKGGEG